MGSAFLMPAFIEIIIEPTWCVLPEYCSCCSSTSFAFVFPPPKMLKCSMNIDMPANTANFHWTNKVTESKTFHVQPICRTPLYTYTIIHTNYIVGDFVLCFSYPSPPLSQRFMVDSLGSFMAVQNFHFRQPEQSARHTHTHKCTRYK